MSFGLPELDFRRGSDDPGRCRDSSAGFGFDASGKRQRWPFAAIQQFSDVSLGHADTLGESRLRDANLGDVRLKACCTTGGSQLRDAGSGEGGMECLHSNDVCIVQTLPSRGMSAVSKSRLRQERARKVKMRYRIKELRVARGWTQDQLAQLAGTNKGYISQLESGKREPSAETLRSLAAAFGIEAAYMIEPVTPAGAATVRLLEKFDQLSPEDQETVQRLVDRLTPKAD